MYLYDIQVRNSKQQWTTAATLRTTATADSIRQRYEANYKQPVRVRLALY